MCGENLISRPPYYVHKWYIYIYLKNVVPSSANVELQPAFFFLLSQKLELIKPGPLASALELQCVSSAAFVLLSLLFHFSKASRRCCGMLAQTIRYLAVYYTWVHSMLQEWYSKRDSLTALLNKMGHILPTLYLYRVADQWYWWDSNSLSN